MITKSSIRNSGIYRVKGDIKNLQIEIKFYCANSIKQLPKYKIEMTNGTEWCFNIIEEKGNIDEIGDNKLMETALIKWQEKIFSLKEVELFSHLENCVTDIQKKYYSYIQDRARKFFNEKVSKETRKRYQKDFKSALGHKIFTYTNKDTCHPLKELHDNDNENPHNCEEVRSQMMYIYVDVNTDIMLAKLQWFPESRIFRVYPNFQENLSDPYNVEIVTDSYHSYCYTLRNVSECLKSVSFLNINDPINIDLKIQTQPNLKPVQNEGEFSMPVKRKRRCNILLEIQAISGFQKRNMYVRYTINLPESCYLEEGLQEASTHSINHAFNSSSNIGFCCEFTILYDENKSEANYHLYILFEIISIDYWRRQRVEGSCFHNISLIKPNHGYERLKCIKPTETLWSTIKNNLFGGNRNFQWNFFPSNYTIRKSETTIVDFHCNYDATTENAGDLFIKYETFMQTNINLYSTSNKCNRRMILDDIILAYKAARRKLSSITE